MKIFLFFIWPLISFSESTSHLQREDIKNSKKPWSFSMSHQLSRGAYYNASILSSHGASFFYKHKDWNWSLSTSYLYPLKYVSDFAHFGWMDTSLGASRSLTSLKGFLNSQWRLALGAALPTAKRSRKKGNYFSLYGVLSSTFISKKKRSLSLNHTLYSDFHRYQTDLSGAANRLMASSHSVQVVFNLKKLTLSGQGVFYIYTYLADSNPDPEVVDTKLRVKGYQGAHLNFSYLLWPKYKLRINGIWSINVPVVSPVLTGFPAFNKNYWLYRSGLSWSF